LRAPSTPASPVFASISRPRRTTLSTRISVPSRASATARSRYCGQLSLSASMKIRSNGASFRAIIALSESTSTVTARAA
jgi:hypothetical protein